MRFFFRSRRFKILIATVIILIALAVGTKLIGGIVSPQTNIVGSIISPFQKAVASVSNAVSGISKRISNNNDLMLENARLKDENNRLTSDLIGYDEAMQKNEFYEQYLEIKENHTDYLMEPAMVISKDHSGIGLTLTIDKGTLNGISAYDPVITNEGLVGYISEVGLNFSKITAVTSNTIKIGAFGRRTRDVGIVTGREELCKDNKTAITGLPRSSSITIGDYIVTSGGSVFPEGLLVGTVDAIDQEKYNSALYATISPAVDFDDLSELMVITYFTGKGNPLGNEGTSDEK